MQKTLVALLLTLFVTPAGASLSPDTITFVSLPDTQIYAEDRLPGGSGGPPVTDPAGTYRYFTDQTQWLADNAAALGIDYVIHLGDIIDNDDVPVEWVRGKAALDILADGGVPYGTVIGNHDAHRASSGMPYYETYIDNFGPQHFTGEPWYGGASPTGVSNYQIIGDGEHQILFLNLALAAPQIELSWADEILKAHRDKLVVLTTHAYMFDLFLEFGRYGEPAPLVGAAAGDGRFNNIHGGDGKPSQEIYLEFIKSHPNIVMAQGGHFDADLYRLDGRNGSNLPVLEIVSDYQGLRNGGDGYLRIYEFDFATGQIHVQTYSPTLDRQRTTFEHFVNAVWLMYQFRDEVGDALGLNPDQAFALIASLFKLDVVPGVDVVGNHPEYLADPDFYDELFVDLFRGSIPSEIGTFSDWERLWVDFFAVDPSNPGDYGPSIRSPAFSIPIDFEQYVDTTPLSSGQRGCLTAMAGQVGAQSGLLTKRNNHNERCVRDAGRGNLPAGLDDCLQNPSGAVVRSAERTERIDTTRCESLDERPRFGVTNAAIVNEAATSASLGMTSDVLGSANIASASADPAAFQCQTSATVRTNALLEKMLRTALREASRGLAGETRNTADLAVGMLGVINADPDGVVERFRTLLGARIARHCHGAGVDVASRLAGPCGDGGDAEAVADCLERQARCRACETLNQVHGAAVSCDFFDDGASMNGSCSE